MNGSKIQMQPIVNTDELAELLGMPAGTLRYWRKIGRGPRSFTLGPRKVMYRVEDVQAWLDEQYKAGHGGFAACD